MLVQGANKTRHAISILCHEAAEDITMHLAVAISDQTAHQHACSGVNGRLHQVMTGMTQHEVLLKLPATSIQGIPSLLAAALKQLTIKCHVLGPSLSIAWYSGHTLNPLLGSPDGLGPAFTHGLQRC